MIGLIGIKEGMSQVFDETGSVIPVTVIKIEKNVVIDVRTEEKNGYSAAVLAAFAVKKNRVSKPLAGQFEKNKIAARRTIVEIRDFAKECKPGDEFGVEVLEGLRFLDVLGMSKGKGFQGSIKRHGFKGGRKTHGSKFHRAIGSSGMNTNPGHTLKGRKMAGRMGFDHVTAQNLRVVRIDAENQLVVVRGAIPGVRGGTVVVKMAKKKS